MIRASAASRKDARKQGGSRMMKKVNELMTELSCVISGY